MRSGATSGSATPAALDQLASTSGARTVGGGSPAHGGGRGSPTPSSDAAAPAATPGRTGSGQRDNQTTRASSLPRPRHERAPNLASSTLWRAADEFANPTRKQRVRGAFDETNEPVDEGSRNARDKECRGEADEAAGE